MEENEEQEETEEQDEEKMKTSDEVEKWRLWWQLWPYIICVKPKQFRHQ